MFAGLVYEFSRGVVKFTPNDIISEKGIYRLSGGDLGNKPAILGLKSKDVPNGVFEYIGNGYEPDLSFSINGFGFRNICSDSYKLESDELIFSRPTSKFEIEVTDKEYVLKVDGEVVSVKVR